MLTISMNINFNKIVERSKLQQSYTQYLYSIQIVKNNYSKPGEALMNTISSVLLFSQERIILLCFYLMFLSLISVVNILIGITSYFSKILGGPRPR